MQIKALVSAHSGASTARKNGISISAYSAVDLLEPIKQLLVMETIEKWDNKKN